MIFENKIENTRSIKMSKTEELRCQIFDGKDYSIWKKRILLYLKWKKCNEPATREKLPAEDQQAWDEKNLKAMNYIYCSITNEQLEFVGDEDTALKIIKKFDQMYLKESTALQICIRNKLYRIKLKDFEESSTFFSEFEKIINKLKSAGAKVNEREKLDYMLKTLPDSLSYVGDLIDSMQESDRTCEFLKNKIKMWETRSPNESGNKKPNVFKAERRDMKCFGCGIRGHLKKNCRNLWKEGDNGGAQWQESARQQQPQQYRGCGGRGNGQRGQGRGWQPRADGTSQHDARYTYNEGYEGNDLGTFLTQLEQKNDGISETVVYNCDKGKIEWILDSGCSDHIINDHSYFSESINLKKPINVKVGDGRILKGTKVGKVITYFMINNRKIKITISNVFYVKEMDKNLISYAKVTDENKIISIGKTSKIYNRNNSLIGIAFKEYGLYKMNSYIETKETSVNNIEKMTQKEKFHRILGHVNFNYLNTMCKEKLVEGMPENFENVILKCGTCIQNKMHNLPFQNKCSGANGILDLVHTDLNGPHRNDGYDGSKYFLTFIDEYSKCALIYTIKSKDEVYNYFLDYINKVENLTGS